MKIFVLGHKSPDLDAVAATVEYAEFLKNSKRYPNTEVIAVIPDNINKETTIIFEKFNIELPKHLDDFQVNEEDRFVLIDHNEESQRNEKIQNDKIIEIVDHHKVNINSNTPIRIEVRPHGSSSTVIYEIFATYGVEPSTQTKQLMLAALLSDTQGLQSSTTTDFDKTVANTLAAELNLTLDEMIFEIFKAKSDITGMTAMDLAKKDYKIFEFGGKKVFINQIETVEPEKVIEQKTSIIEALNQIKTQEGAQQAYCVITDIHKINSQIIVTNEVEKMVAEKAFNTTIEDNIGNIGAKMSRKKDIAPPIEQALAN